MFYNELAATTTSEPVKEFTVLFRYFRNYHAAVLTCVSHKWPRYVVSYFEARTPLQFFFFLFFAKIVIVSFIIHFENLGTAIFKKHRNHHLSCRQSVKTVSETARVARLQSQRYTFLDQLSKQLKIAAVITVKYNLPINLIQNKFYRRCSTKGTEQCSFVKHLLILIAREHKRNVPSSKNG